MRLRRLQRSALARWLAVIALSIQALIPTLLAAEISLAEPAAGGLFTLCAFGHLHPATPHEEGSGSHHSDDSDDGALCPICLALLASPVFTAVPTVFLPLPPTRSLEIVVASEVSIPTARVFDAYRSRAPPFG